MLRCKTCNEVRTNEYFYGTGRNGKIFYVTRKCKICSGVKVRDKFSHKPVRVKGYYDKRLLYLFLLRMGITKGLATTKDVMNLEISYTQIYGDSIPEFVNRSDGLIFMYEKLKEFDCGLDNSGGGGKKNYYKRKKHIIGEQEIINALKQCNGNKSETAKLLNIHHQTLYNKLKVYKLNALDFKKIIPKVEKVKKVDIGKEEILIVMNQCNGNVTEAAKKLGISYSKLSNRVKLYDIETKDNRGLNKKGAYEDIETFLNKEKNKKAIEYIKMNYKSSEISEITGLNKNTITKIKKCLNSL